MDLSEDTKVSPKRGETSKVEPGELLEEGWFFGNLLDRKTRTMSRCFSDPCPSSKVSQETLVGKSYEETYSSINKLVFSGDGRDGEVVATPPQPHPPRPSLMRTPSMPSPNRSKSSKEVAQTSHTTTTNNNRLQRTPSLPAMDMDMDNFEDEESDYSMGRLIRQASLGQSRTLPPRQNPPKKLIRSTIPKQQYPRRKPEQEGAIQRRRQQHIWKKETNENGLANLETDKLKDFKGSGIDSPIKEIKILPKLQELKITEEDEEEEEDPNESIKVRKSYVPEARRLERTTSASPVLDSISSLRKSDDMKEQLKFWARAVASNVR
ncbi:hypothetical protein Leryth_010066 [Lithospermum erythrorhizon]|nr:hypothetical protein Leryth_010066 [Lithospermum erythrorhizon]